MFVEKMIAILQPFKKASELRSVENTPTLSMVLPVIDQLTIALAPIEEGDDENVEIKRRKKKMLK